MTINVYDIGDRRKLTAELRDEDGALADPTVLTFYMREPDDTVTDFVYGTDVELVKDSPGIYHVYWDITQSGFHHWRYEATGTVAAAEEANFTVRQTQFPAPPPAP